MITKENLKDVLMLLKIEDVKKALDERDDYVLVSLHTFNAGSVATIECREYDDDVAMTAGEYGDLFIDKDDFLRISSEVGINWEQ